MEEGELDMLVTGQAQESQGERELNPHLAYEKPIDNS